MIILTWPIFEHQDKPLFLFIEEPDMFLHPGYQNGLIDTILNDQNSKLYVFVTTHSPQFVDITLRSEQCSIFRCTQDIADSDAKDELEYEPTFAVTNASHGDKSILNHIGVRPSALMFANCTIWVEGITDRQYYGRYLELWFRENGMESKYIENLHYAFVEYSGNNIEHWSFLDKESGIDAERFVRTCS